MTEDMSYQHAFPKHMKAPVINGCGQGCVHMVIDHFEQAPISTDELNAVCGVKNEGAFSSTLDIANGMASRGYDVIRISDIPSAELQEEPLKFMRAVGFDPGEDSPILDERRVSAAIFQQNVKAGQIIEHERAPEVRDIQELINDGYALISWVNSSGLAGNFNVTSGHYVVPITLDNDYVVYHDPGAISEKYGERYGAGLKAHTAFFDKAMRYPESCGVNKHTGEARKMGLLAFRPSSHP